VRLCEVCETWEKADQAISAQDGVLTRKYNEQLARAEKAEKTIEILRAELELAHKFHDIAVKERDLARYQLAKLTEAPKPRLSGTGLCPYCGQPAGSADCQRSHP
jgi:hypothetical protein